MKLEILTPEKKLFSGEVYGVQMPGISGIFEVLDKHAPLVSALKAGRMKVLNDKNNSFFFFDTAVDLLKYSTIKSPYWLKEQQR